MTFSGHTDYVRSGSFLPSSPHQILTGSYDSTVKLWDTRTGNAEMTMAHDGYAVEAVLPYPSGGMVLSAGGPVVRVWDLAAGGRCLRAVSNHQKTITCLAFDGVGKKRVLSGGLDQMVKVYDVLEGRSHHALHRSRP
jgi:U3 small nucleolar RNA-associated protein 15